MIVTNESGDAHAIFRSNRFLTYLIITLIIVTVYSLFTSTFSQNNQNIEYSGINLGNLDSLGVDAKNETYSNLDYLEGFEKPEEENPRFRELIKQIKQLGTSEEENYLQKIYNGLYVNTANNTVFVSVTGEPAAVKEELVEALNPSEDFTIIVRKVNNTLPEIEAALDKILEVAQSRDSKKYCISTIGGNQKGKIVIELIKVNFETVQDFLNDLPQSIPLDMLIIRRGSQVTPA